MKASTKVTDTIPKSPRLLLGSRSLDWRSELHQGVLSRTDILFGLRCWQCFSCDLQSFTMTIVALCPNGSSVLLVCRCHSVCLSHPSLLRPCRHDSLVILLFSFFIFPLTLVFFFPFLLLPPLDFPAGDWRGPPEEEKEEKGDSLWGGSWTREDNLPRRTCRGGVAESRAIACHPAIRGVQHELNHWMTIINPLVEQEGLRLLPLVLRIPVPCDM